MKKHTSETEVTRMEKPHVIETVTHEFFTIDGKDLPVTVTKRIGRDTYINDKGEPFEASEAWFFDYGPKLGTTRCYVTVSNRDYSDEERAAGRKRIQEAGARAMQKIGIW